jgi:hypothetical protein
MNKNAINSQVSDDILSTIKALSKNSNIVIEIAAIEDNFFSWNQDLIRDQKIILPQISSMLQSRAAADLAACYLLFHNQQIHQEFFCEEQNLFDAFEKIRVISNVKNLYRGVAKNILQKISQDAISPAIVDSNRFSLQLLQEISLIGLDITK